MREREVVRESVPVAAEREIIVDEGPRRGGGGGALVAIVGVLLVLILAWFLLQALDVFGEAAEDGNPPDARIEVDA